ncbi:MAG: hypothetical protein ACTSQ8_27110 [Candidatus Helarchaeota archaeon]
MMEQTDFERWVKAVHSVFEIFEGRYNAYPICRQWVDGWFNDESFTINSDNKEGLSQLIANFDYNAFKNRNWGEKDEEKWNEFIGKIDSQFKRLLKEQLIGSNIGLGIAPYLFTWNFQRFKEYFKRKENFDLFSYFENLGNFVNDIKNELINFREMKIYYNEVSDIEIREIFDTINSKLKALGINQNEPVGVAKLLHIFAPDYFPLIDNPIAEATGLKKRTSGYGERLTVDKYLKWMKSLKRWIELYDNKKITEIEKQYNESILKLIDEGFYVMSSVKLNLRIKLMGLKITD